MIYRPVERGGDSIGHFCGIVGIYSVNEINIPEKLFYLLFSLQHRGQESAGLAYRKAGKLVAYKDLGMVSSVLGRYLHEQRPSKVGIGHVRYSTTGGNMLENAQPIVAVCNKGELAMAHNGNISNTTQLKSKLFADGSIFQSTSDTELILHLLSRNPTTDFLEALKHTLGLVQGAFSMAMIWNDCLLGVRDLHGFRPLYLGTGDGLSVLASETCALDMLGIAEQREVEPGEIVVIGPNGVVSTRLEGSARPGRCVFELIYFARPDSQVFGESVYLARKRMGAALAAQDARAGGIPGEIVVPVPDSGSSAALGYAEAAGIPFELALTRNHYAGRSFIMPTTAERELAVRMKLHPVRRALAGRRIVLVDDSLVRGTTSRALVRLLKDAGASQVHLRLTAPEIKWPCFFGIDIPTRAELISNRLDPSGLAGYIGADSVKFLGIPGLRDCLASPERYCYACFNGDYPCSVPEIE